MRITLSLLAIATFAATALVPGAGAAPPGAIGAATPSTVPVGGSTLLTVTVAPGVDPPSTDLGVVCNTSPIGGPLLLLHDDGTNGDLVPNDLVFSQLVTVAQGTTPGTVGIFCVVNDGQGRTAFTTISLEVVPASENEPPSVSAGGPYQVDEGSNVQLSATGTDPESGPLTYSWDLDNNGTFETAGKDVSFTGVDGPATQTVQVRVVDAAGLDAVGTTTVTVLNVPPTALFDAPSSVSAGVAFQLSLTDPHDPAQPDSATGFSYAFDCGDGYAAFGPSSSATCPTIDTGRLAVGGKVRDKDGGVTEYRALVEVIVSFASLCDLTREYSTKPQIGAALCVKLHNAAVARNEHARNGLLGAYANQVDAQTGKAFTADQAAVLEQLAERLKA